MVHGPVDDFTEAHAKEILSGAVHQTDAPVHVGHNQAVAHQLPAVQAIFLGIVLVLDGVLKRAEVHDHLGIDDGAGRDRTRPRLFLSDLLPVTPLSRILPDSGWGPGICR